MKRLFLLIAPWLAACPSPLPEGSDCTTSLWYADNDGDGFGDDEQVTASCSFVTGTVSRPGDCNDEDPDIHPSADELCNAIDDDCNGRIDDDAEDGQPFWPDLDRDGYGEELGEVIIACEAPERLVDRGGDCDDLDGRINPGADEVCDQRDNDCDKAIDEDAIDAPTWFADNDGDGFGDTLGVFVSCDRPQGFVDLDGDCDDTSASVHPDAREICNDGIDQDCNEADLVCGFSGTYSTADAVQAWRGGSSDRLADVVRAAGDLDGDGYDDLFAAVPLEGRATGGGGSITVPGFATALYGDGTWSGTRSAGGEPRWGKDVSGGCADGVGAGGDLDGDGYDDVIIGSGCRGAFRRGHVQVLYGDPARPSGSTPFSAFGGPILEGGYDAAEVGTRASLVGDLDGDGYDELIAAGWGAGWLVYGGPKRLASGVQSLSAHPRFDADSMMEIHGAGMAGGDLDGDGYDDLVMSTVGRLDLLGTVRVHRGRTTRFAGATRNADADLAIDGEAVLGFGTHVAIGDVDDDGYQDLAIASPSENPGGTAYTAGTVRIFLGDVTATEDALAASDADIVLIGDTRDALGTDLALGELDDKPGVDVLAGTVRTGALVWGDLGSRSGRYTRADADAELSGAPSLDGLGEVVGIADINGDGAPDIAVGARDAAAGDGVLYLFSGAR